MSRRPRGTGWEALTAAERRIADLVAQGLTNPQIAQRLFVSRYTVQTHLRNAFRKLGVRTRAQLAVEVVLRRETAAPAPTPGGGRILHRGPGFALGVFHCAPGDPRWERENFIGNKHHVVFPSTAVLIRRPGAEVVADANVAVLYDGGQTYRRELIDRRGDHCAYAAVEEALVAEMAGVPRGTRPSFPAPAVGVEARVYALQWMSIATLLGVYAGDRLAPDERVLALLGTVVRTAFGSGGEPPRGPAPLVAKAKRVLAERMTEPLSVAEIARGVPASPYHLIRLFRRETGMTLHRYRTHLRLRASLDRLARKDEPVGRIATSLGFSSHSHFTDCFTRTFGATPTDVRTGRLAPSDLCGVLTT
ncbi:MAG TPA: helix-turn-helix domain-containing protein [Actinomycetota bacterium]|nr:helix-turn-helix domain-containing protein [Actinomycetota bacterium]